MSNSILGKRKYSDRAGALSVKANFSWVLLGNIIFGFSQWLIISLMTKFGSIEMVGQYTLALGITAPLFLLLNFNLRAIQATDQKNQYNFIYYYSFRSLTSFVALFFIIVILIFLDYSLTTSVVILMAGVYKFIGSQSDVVFGYFQKIEYMSLISFSKIIKGILNVITVLTALLITNNLIVVLLGLIVVNLLIFTYYDKANLYKKGVERVKIRDLFFVLRDKKKLLAIFVMGLPLGMASSLDSLTINSQRYVLEYTMSLKEVGFYASITYIMTSGQTIVGALSQAALPRLTKYFIEDFKKYTRLILLLVFIGITMGVFLITVSYFFGGFILSILYTEEFKEYSQLLFVVMIVASVWYLTGFLNAALLATRRFNAQLVVYLISFVVTFIFTIIFTKDFGLIGSAYALLAGMITRLMVISLVLIKTICKKKLQSSNIL